MVYLKANDKSYRKDLIWNPFKRGFWKWDNLLPPQERKQLREDLSRVRDEAMADIDKTWGRDGKKKKKSVSSRIMSIGWRLTWMITLPLLLTVFLGILGMIIGAIIFFIGLIGLFRK